MSRHLRRLHCRPTPMDLACSRGSAILVLKGKIGEKVTVAASDTNRRTSPRILFAFGGPQPIKGTRMVGMRLQVRAKRTGDENKIDGIETSRDMGGRDGVTGHVTKVATIDDWIGNEIMSQPHVLQFRTQLETVWLACISLTTYYHCIIRYKLSSIAMLSGLVTSPTFDLGGRSRNASSKPLQATVDPTDAPIGPVTRAAISIEYASLRHDKHCPTGMYVIPSAESILIWDATLFVHKGE